MDDQSGPRCSERRRSVEELRGPLGLPRDKGYRWMERKGFPVHRIGKLAEVDDWARSGGVNREDIARTRRRSALKS